MQIEQVELRPHTWADAIGRHKADFLPFVNGAPRHDIGCDSCIHFRENSDCARVQEQGYDDKLYPWCGPVCGHFEAAL